MAKGPIQSGVLPPMPVAKIDLDGLIARGKADPTAVRTFRCRTIAKGRFHQLSYIRDLPPQPVMEDEPEGLLGEAIAPNASEALLAAFGSCLAVGIHANGVAQSIPIRGLELELEADINTTAVWGAGDLNPKTIGFEAVRVSVRLDADAPRATLVALVRHAMLWSPVANTLHNPVHLDVALAAATVE
jgi:OsmC-like protein